MREGRELALRLDDGTVIRDSDWRCVADIMWSFHGFFTNVVYGTIIYVDTGEVHEHHSAD